jgi:hypothetical protein
LKDLDAGDILEDAEERRKEIHAVEVKVGEVSHPIGADPMEVGNEHSEGRIVVETKPRIGVTVHEEDAEASEQLLQEVILVCHVPLYRPRWIGSLRGSVSNGFRRLEAS